MKIAVVGTSNSILASGYFPLYKAMENPNQADNFSHGASYCHYIPFALEKYAILENYDFLITDCCPNDGSFFPYARTENWFYNELLSIFSQIKEKNCKHLHLIFPTDIPFAIHEEIHRQVCTELGIPFLDIGAILKNAQQKPEQPLYADKMHIAPYYAKQIACLIKQKRQEITNTQTSINNSPFYKHKEYFLYDLAKNSNKLPAKTPVITHATSLRAEKFIQLKHNDEICLENLPCCNLESLYFYTNFEAGYYSLTSENTLKNYNLNYHLANIFHFRPIPANTFPVNKFLKIKAGFNLACQEVMEEFNFPPHDKNNSELSINALLFSKEVNPPRTWQKKEAPPINEKDLKNYNKISAFINNLAQYQNHKLSVPDEFILTGAALFPAHAAIRKRFVTILKTTQNPYYFFHFVQLYLLPRKKYNMAGKMLEYALTLKKDILFAEFLAKCYLAQNLSDKAYSFILQEIPAKNPIVRLKLLLAWAEKAKNKKAFIEYAKEMLAYGTSLNHMALLVETALSFQEYELAKEFFSLITNDPRNFQHDRDKQRINSLIKHKALNAYRGRIKPIQLVPFAYAFSSKANTASISVQWAEKILDAGSPYNEFIADTSNAQVKIAFSASIGVTDFKVLKLKLQNVDDNGNPIFLTEELCVFSVLRPGLPLVVGMTFGGSIPSYGISYTDENGFVKQFAIVQSGQDGSILLQEF